MSVEQPDPVWKIACIWAEGHPAQEMLLSAIRWADLTAGVTLRLYRTPAGDFERDVVTPLQEWQPHGLLVGVDDWREVEPLRHAMPNIPLVATLYIPPDLADTIVVADIQEALTLARDYYHKRGVKELALYTSGSQYAVPSRLEAFRAVVPDGRELVYSEEAQPTPPVKRVEGPSPKADRILARQDAATGAAQVRGWLQALPKPVGVIATETFAAGFLLRQCGLIDLNVPEEVQIISTDNALECLRREPNLTSLEIPRARIGEVAMETLLQHVRGTQPPPPPLVRVGGTMLIPRGSTGPAQPGAPAVRAALRVLGARTGRAMTTTELAQHTGVGRSTLYRHFANATGQSPARHLRQKRLEDACRLLRETEATVTAIAKTCGFSSVFAFTKCFSRELGQPPTAYRRQTRTG